MKTLRPRIACLLLICALTAPTFAGSVIRFEVVNDLEYAQLEAIYPDSTRALIHILRMNPALSQLSLLSSHEYQTTPQTTEDWCDKYGYEVAFNAGMFAKDGLTSLGYCRNYDLIINPRINKYNSILVFNPRNPTDPVAKIVDRRCEDFDSLSSHYNTFLQSIRMISCERANLWKPAVEKHAVMALAEDSAGNLLLLFSPAAVKVHDFIDQILKLPLGIIRMMYLEGGHHASLYVHIDNLLVDLTGEPENSAVMPAIGAIKPTLPNVLAIKRKISTKE